MFIENQTSNNTVWWISHDSEMSTNWKFRNKKNQLRISFQISVFDQNLYKVNSEFFFSKRLQNVYVTYWNKKFINKQQNKEKKIKFNSYHTQNHQPSLAGTKKTHGIFSLINGAKQFNVRQYPYEQKKTNTLS